MEVQMEDNAIERMTEGAELSAIDACTASNNPWVLMLPIITLPATITEDHYRIRRLRVSGWDE